MSKDRNIPQKEKIFQVSSKIETKVVSWLSKKAGLTWLSFGVGGSTANLCCLVVCLSSETAVYWSIWNIDDV